MARRITDWLRSQPLPRNAYELLGHPLLDPDRDALLQTIRTANRELLDYQSHPEPAVAKRAMFLLTELGRYRGIFEDAGKHQAYADDLCKTLREQFVAERGPLSLHSGNDLGAWLGLAYGVPSAAAEAVVRAVRGTVPPAQTLPKRGSKFGAFQSSPSEPIEAEVVELIEPAPAVVKPPVYDLSDPPPAPLPPKPRKPARLEPVDRVPRKLPRQEKESSLAIPLAIGGGALMLLAIVTAVVIVMSGEPEKEVRNEKPFEQKPIPEPEPEPRPEPEPEPEPEPPKKVNPPKVDPEPPKKVDSVPPKKVNPPKVDPEPPKKVDPPKVDPEPPKKVDPPKKIEPKDDFDPKDWAEAEGGKPADRVRDVFVRIHSAGIRTLRDNATRDTSDPLLVIWVEVLNRSTVAYQSKRWMDWGSPEDKFYYETSCQLFNGISQIEKPYWLNLRRTQIVEMPRWQDDLPLPPGKSLLIPVVFKKPPTEQKTLRLELGAVRAIGERGKGEEYGRFILRLKDSDWKKAPPTP